MFRAFASLATACLLAAVCLTAQAPPGAITGKVTDKRGDLVSGAVVTLNGPALAAPRTVVTKPGGAYAFPGVPDGVYQVTFQMLGLCTVTSDEMVVAGGPVTINGKLADDASHLRCPGDSGELIVRIQTTLGNIDISIVAARAPITSINFLKYVDGGFYNGGRFYRAARPDTYKAVLPNRPPLELIEADIAAARKADAFPPIPLERTSVTGLRHLAGTVAMGRDDGKPDSATSDFYILLNNQPSLDFGGARFDDHQGTAAFGGVTSGLDVVRRIQRQPTDGQTLTPPVTIVRAYRLPPEDGGG